VRSSVEVELELGDRPFKRFCQKLELPNLMTKADYHRLAGHLSTHAIDTEITETLDAVVAVAQRAQPREE